MGPQEPESGTDAEWRTRKSAGHPWRLGRFPTLMNQRVEEILLVSSPYDSFILEEDGLLTELIYSEYADLGLTHAPNVTRVPTATSAFNALRHQHFDLVIAMPRLGDMDVDKFRHAIQSRDPNLPVVLLISSEAELKRFVENTGGFDARDVYVWHGEAKLFLAIIKAIEDRWNVEHDTRVGGVGVIILLEDSIQFRSSLLPIIYSELVNQSRTVLADGINRMHKVLRMRARPKILVADSFERGSDDYRRFRKQLFGVISDVRFWRDGKLDPHAGIDFIRQVKRDHPDLPVLLQSSDEANRSLAESVGASFLHKRSLTLLHDVRDFMLNNFGFGDFVFRMPDGQEIARASDLHSLVRMLRRVPASSIDYHARRNHFSNWLRARTEFELARQLRPRRVSEFDDLETLRQYLISACDETMRRNRRGVIEDFSRHRFDAGSHFARIGGGSLGGKARGLAFVDALLARHKLHNAFEGVNIFVPRSVVIGTDVFDEFMQKNGLWRFVEHEAPDQEVRDAFVQAELSTRVMKDLWTFLHVVRVPIAVRSSSLLEDSQYHPFAGVYSTFMIPNNHADNRRKLTQLATAIKRVFASAYYRTARRYIGNTPHRIEEQRMAVILEPVVGRQRGQYYYPSIAGTARSYNYYPFGHMRPDDGIASVALGLGSLVVDGGPALRFCPEHPQVLPQMADSDEFINRSQRTFYAIDTKQSDADLAAPDYRGMVTLDIDVAEQHGTLAPLGSIWSPENQAFFDGIYRPGVRVVTFAHVLKSDIFPLAPILKRLLKIGRSGMNAPVDIEFAANLDVEPKEMVVLQIRPCIAGRADSQVKATGLPRAALLCESPRAMGNGLIRDVSDVIYVNPDEFDPAKTESIARQIGSLNARLTADERACMLIGPGRWGTSDHWLGIPVNWSQISTVRIMVETCLEDFIVDPSQGSHFFHNLISFGIVYLSVNQRAREGFIDWDWLQAQPVVNATEHVRHVRLAAPLEARIDGRTSHAAVLKHVDGATRAEPG
ncbi:MAG: histidine kinase [Phycisphaerae bacterium]|nr:histidine kinase [Phycisphaerae bacterium]